MRYYYNALAGAFGGLLAFVVYYLLALALANTSLFIIQAVPYNYYRAALQGIVVGACLSAALAFINATLERSLKEARTIGLIGLVIGIPVGLISLLLSEFIVKNVLGGIPVQALAWGLFGGLIGVTLRTGGQAWWKPGLGGLIGGLIGGLLRGLLQQSIADETLGVALGFIFVGAMMGILIVAVSAVLRSAYVERIVMAGPKMKKPGLFAGVATVFTLDKYLMNGESVVIGSNLKAIGGMGKGILIDDDPMIADRHATLHSEKQRPFVLTNLSKDGTFVNGSSVTSVTLNDGDRIKLGTVELMYHARTHQESAKASGKHQSAPVSVAAPAPAPAPMRVKPKVSIKK